MKKILIAGGSGFIGSYLMRAALRNGWQPVVLSRNADVRSNLAYPAPSFSWDKLDTLDPNSFSAVVNLCGHGIMDVAWNSKGKQRLSSSRIEPTKQLREWLEAANPATVKKSRLVYLQASATGFYGDQGDKELTETSKRGEGFSAELCQQWETQAQQADEQGFRTCILRIPPVLGHGGGMLQTLDQLYSYGLGASLGRGDQWLPWIHIDDLCSLMFACIENEAYQGFINACAPAPVKYAAFHNALCHAKQVRGTMPVPSFLLKLLYRGGKASVLLNSQRVIPEKALSLGFEWRYANLDACLAALYPHVRLPGAFFFYRQQWVAADLQENWRFFADETNLEKITPEFLKFKVKGKSTPKLEKDTLIHYRLKIKGIPVSWRTRMIDWQPPYFFSDFQQAGPYRLWFHEHRFEQCGNGVWASDLVQYSLPLGTLGTWFAGWLVRKDVAQIFKHRQRVIFDLFNKKHVPELAN